jgi:hypothetical protein
MAALIVGFQTVAYHIVPPQEPGVNTEDRTSPSSKNGQVFDVAGATRRRSIILLIGPHV